MARIRTIKPDFWSDERVGGCSPMARLLFIGTWNFADDCGNLHRSARQLKAQIFPYDTFDCEPLIKELVTAGLLVEYGQEKQYLHIKGFETHQLIVRKSKPRYPVCQQSDTTHRAVPEDSLSTHRALNEHSMSTHLRKEGSKEVRKETEGKEVSPDNESWHNLTPVEFGRKLLEEIGLPYSGNITVVADAIAAEAKFSHIPEWKAYEQILAQAQSDQKTGRVKVDHFYFQNAKHRNATVPVSEGGLPPGYEPLSVKVRREFEARKAAWEAEQKKADVT